MLSLPTLFAVTSLGCQLLALPGGQGSLLGAALGVPLLEHWACVDPSAPGKTASTGPESTGGGGADPTAPLLLDFQPQIKVEGRAGRLGPQSLGARPLWAGRRGKAGRGSGPSSHSGPKCRAPVPVGPLEPGPWPAAFTSCLSARLLVDTLPGRCRAGWSWDGGPETLGLLPLPQGLLAPTCCHHARCCTGPVASAGPVGTPWGPRAGSELSPGSVGVEVFPVAQAPCL